jgi:hypothetical protein
MTRRIITVLAVILAVLGVAPLAFAQQGPRLPTELWEEYPLDPTVGEEESQPATTGEGPTETGPVPATGPTSTREPAANRQVARAPVEEEEDGSIVVPLAVGLGGIGLFLVVGALFVSRRRRQSPDVEAGPRPSPGVSPEPSLHGRLASERGSVALFAERPPPRTVKVPGGKNPPPGKDVPRLDSLPEKKRQARSGLPPGKAIPANREVPKPAPKGGARALSKPSDPPATAEKPELLHDLVSEAPSTPPPAARPLRAGSNVRGHLEECVIEWWRGYVRSEFYAVSVAPDGRTDVVARSRPFTWHWSDVPPRTGVTADAHADLVAALAAEGWEQAGGGTPWYRTRFRRVLGPTLRELAEEPGRL